VAVSLRRIQAGMRITEILLFGIEDSGEIHNLIDRDLTAYSPESFDYKVLRDWTCIVRFVAERET